MTETILDTVCKINTDCWNEIFKYIYDYKSWISLTNTCKFLHQYNRYDLNKRICIRHIVMISLNPTHKMYNNYKKLNMSYTNDFDIEFIRNHMNYKWDWIYISKHINITYIDMFPKLPWKWYEIADNRTITSNFVIKYFDNFKYNWNKLAQNPQLSMHFILQNYYKYYTIYNNIYEPISFNRKIDLNYVVNNLDLAWNFHGLLLNHGGNFDFILKIAHKLVNTVNWYYVSLYLEDFNNVIKYPSIPWDFNGLSRNKRIKLDDVLNITELFMIMNKPICWEFNRLGEYVKITKSDFINNLRIKKCFGNNELANKFLTIDNTPKIYPQLPDKYKRISKDCSQNIYTHRISPYIEPDVNKLNHEYLSTIRFNKIYIDIDYIKHILKNIPQNEFNRIKGILTNSKFISLIDIVAYPEIPWDYDQFYFDEKIFN